jgi:hypothetical protein
MEATCSSETSADIQKTTQCYIPENRTIFFVLFRMFCAILKFLSTAAHTLNILQEMPMKIWYVTLRRTQTVIKQENHQM